MYLEDMFHFWQHRLVKIVSLHSKSKVAVKPTVLMIRPGSNLHVIPKYILCGQRPPAPSMPSSTQYAPQYPLRPPVPPPVPSAPSSTQYALQHPVRTMWYHPSTTDMHINSVLDMSTVLVRLSKVYQFKIKIVIHEFEVNFLFQLTW